MGGHELTAFCRSPAWDCCGWKEMQLQRPADLDQDVDEVISFRKLSGR